MKNKISIFHLHLPHPFLSPFKKKKKKNFCSYFFPFLFPLLEKERFLFFLFLLPSFSPIREEEKRKKVFVSAFPIFPYKKRRRKEKRKKEKKEGNGDRERPRKERGLKNIRFQIKEDIRKE